MKYLDFKTIEPFYSLCRDGKKPFDIRIYDGKDTRFRRLNQLPHRYVSNWAIRFVNLVTGEQFARQLTGWRDIENEYLNIMSPRWIILFLGDIVPNIQEREMMNKTGIKPEHVYVY